MKTIFNSTASKAAAAVAVAAVAGLVAAGCGSDNAVGAPVVGNSNKPASLYWSSTLADNQALVLNLVRGMGMDPVTDAMGEMPMSAGDLDPINLNSGCPKQTLNYTAAAYAAAAGFTYPATINYTQGWLTLGGAATCTADATGNYTGTWDSMNGSFYANLTGLGSTTLTDFTANYFTNQSISLTQGGNETLIDKSTATDRQAENNMATMVAINFSGGLPLSGSINGSGWSKYQDGGNWFGTTLAHNQTFNSKTVTNVTWAATTNVWATTYTTAFNGGYAVSNGSVPAMPTTDGSHTVTLANVTQNDVCAGSLGEPDGGKITISNGVTTDTIVIDMTDTTLSYNLGTPTTLDCGSAMVSVGGAAAVKTAIFTGPVFTNP